MNHFVNRGLPALLKMSTERERVKVEQRQGGHRLTPMNHPTVLRSDQARLCDSGQRGNRERAKREPFKAFQPSSSPTTELSGSVEGLNGSELDCYPSTSKPTRMLTQFVIAEVPCQYGLNRTQTACHTFGSRISVIPSVLKGDIPARG